MRERRRTGLVLAALLVAAALATGCGDDSSDSGSADHNDADVAFAQEMVPHHEQALRMVAMTEGRELSPDFEQVAQQVQDAQEPEIETMTGWLEEWGEEVPSGHGHHDGMDGMDGMDGAAGMMSDDDLADLEAAGRSAFERMWLAMMIEHHEGAVAMARTEIGDGDFPPARDLAGSIVESQTREIDQMRKMLGRQA